MEILFIFLTLTTNIGRVFRYLYRKNALILNIFKTMMTYILVC